MSDDPEPDNYTPEKARKAIQVIQCVMEGWLELSSSEIPVSLTSVQDAVDRILYCVTYLDMYLTGSISARNPHEDPSVVGQFFSGSDVHLTLSAPDSVLILSWPKEDTTTLHVEGPAKEKWNVLHES